MYLEANLFVIINQYILLHVFDLFLYSLIYEVTNEPPSIKRLVTSELLRSELGPFFLNNYQSNGKKLKTKPSVRETS